MTARRSRCDVLIIGGGPAGASLALQLARRRYRCLVAEKQATPPRTMGEALKPAAGAILRELGLWDELQRQGPASTFVTHVHWAGRSFAKASVHDRHGPELHVARDRFDAWLKDSARAAGVEWWAPARIRALRRSGAGYEVVVRRGERDVEVEAEYLVDATGRSASIARRLGATRSSADGLVGFCRWYRAANVAPFVLVEAAPDGWWYSAPVPEQPGADEWNAKAVRASGELVVLFITDPRAAAARAWRRDQAWRELLQQAPATCERLSAAVQDGAPRCYLAGPALTQWSPGQRWLPVGDAALSFDPIAADGLCFALRSSIEAAAHLVAELDAKPQPTSYCQAIQVIYQQHLARRTEHYRAEAAAHGHSFWQRRLQRSL